MSGHFYLTTPIYYVNDEPHIGHVYTTTVADAIARWHRQRGEDVFFLTGTDEHAAKVADAAAERGLAPIELADRNAKVFQETFERFRFSHDDFIRTTQERHKEKTTRYVSQLVESGDVYLGEYEGWYDAGEEEYVPEERARQHDFKSPVSGRELVRKKEKNYFFRLTRYADDLLALLDERPDFVRPEARRNEVIGRLRQGLNDVPVSRTGAGSWGIEMPGDPGHRVYVWIDALFNYLTAIDTDERRHYWPADVHLMAKEILWFHAVIWPAMLMALRRVPGNEWLELPRCVYVHSYWVHEGQKMSKSLGNFVTLEDLDRYVETFGLDALRYYLISQGPLGVHDSDFADARFRDLYHADLANKLGNLVSRTLQMTAKFCNGVVPKPGVPEELEQDFYHTRRNTIARVVSAMTDFRPDAALAHVMDLVVATNRYLDERAPWKAAKDSSRVALVPTTLHFCCEALREIGYVLEPFLPETSRRILQRLGFESGIVPHSQIGDMIPPGQRTSKGEALFPRVESTT